jgi:Tfp pilus assembly protein PilF
MKRYVLLLVVLIICCLMTAYVGYRVGERVGDNRVTTARAANAVIILDALKRLKAGDVAEATRSLERRCFADAAGVLSDTGWRVEAYQKMGVPSLIAYRESYRTNQADWTPTEQKLEKLLAQKP